MILVLSTVLFTLLVVIPAVLLFQAGTDWVGHRIEASRPGQPGAAELGFWFKWLAPLVVSMLLLILLVFLILGR